MTATNINTDLTVPALVRSIICGERLDDSHTQSLMEALTRGELSEIQVAAVLSGLHARGETATELAATARVFRKAATDFPYEQPTDVADGLIDIVGTGGDGAHSINISTTAGLVLASMGVHVAKHGNRSVSSRCGAADVLEELGLDLEASPQDSAQLLAETNFCFLFAQAYHPAMRFVGPVRRALASPTIFNLVGPLINPAPLSYQVMGVANPDLMDLVAQAMMELGRSRALVVHGDGMDEIAVHGSTQMRLVDNGNISTLTLTPEEMGISTHPKSSTRGGDAQENAEITRAILEGTATDAYMDAVAVNAGAALFVVNRVESIAEGTAMAMEHMRAGRPAQHLTTIINRVRA
ncbi:anthranilate phosphoribosyltransferase [Actinomyces vulturis]|uniref:anthranilate phosphoribosyltransferase n=1 Tax=Actinomyces vulturis TaxID=1857645 RepID=UPI0008375B83|nr:anthranilate phosphoribosyltransferase [Actinomyces vulturis]